MNYGRYFLTSKDKRRRLEIGYLEKADSAEVFCKEDLVSSRREVTNVNGVGRRSSHHRLLASQNKGEEERRVKMI